MDHDEQRTDEMSQAEAAELIARRLAEHDERLARLAARFAGLQQVRNDLQDLRHEVRDVAPSSGLAAAIEAIATQGGNAPAPDEAITRTAHEVAAAALASVPWHGDVTAAGIGIRHEDGWLTVAVGDNGPDGDPALSETFQRLEARVNALNGHFSRSSTPGEGTMLVVGLPGTRER